MSVTAEEIAGLFKVPLELATPCHGYQNACPCPHCADRSRRTQLYLGLGTPDPYRFARDESAEYFATPWKFDNQTPPHRLGD